MGKDRNEMSSKRNYSFKDENVSKKMYICRKRTKSIQYEYFQKANLYVIVIYMLYIFLGMQVLLN